MGVEMGAMRVLEQIKDHLGESRGRNEGEHEESNNRDPPLLDVILCRHHGLFSFFFALTKPTGSRNGVTCALHQRCAISGFLQVMARGKQE